MLHAALPASAQKPILIITRSQLSYPSLLKWSMKAEREHSILQYVTITLDVYEVCHSVNSCVKNASCSSSSLEWKSVDSIADISYCLNKC